MDYLHISILFCTFANDKNKDNYCLCFSYKLLSVKVSNGTEMSNRSFSQKLPSRNH